MTEDRDPAADVQRPQNNEDRAGEHDRIRSSNDRDQQLEREGEVSSHNRGYDRAADGAPAETVAGDPGGTDPVGRLENADSEDNPEPDDDARQGR